MQLCADTPTGADVTLLTAVALVPTPADASAIQCRNYCLWNAHTTDVAKVVDLVNALCSLMEQERITYTYLLE